MKRVIRLQKNTVFGFGEGEAEKIFLKHLRSIYSSDKTSVRIDAAGGKDPSYIIDKAVRIRGDIKYNYSFILLDTDRVWTPALQSKAARKRLELIGSSPCLEGLLLSILSPNTNHTNHSSNDCKRDFQNNYLHANRTLTDADCKRLFSKITLDAVRATIQSIGRVIEIMEGNF